MRGLVRPSVSISAPQGAIQLFRRRSTFTCAREKGGLPERCLPATRSFKDDDKRGGHVWLGNADQTSRTVSGCLRAGILGLAVTLAAWALPSVGPLKKLYPAIAEVHAAEELALRSSSLPPLPLDLPPLAALQPAILQQFTLPNGLFVVLIEDHEVPTVKGQLLMRGGQRASPEDKVGLASISALVQRSGGTMQHPGPELDDLLEQLAATVESTAASDATGIGFSCLREDTAQVLGLFAEVLQQPSLPEDKIAQSRSQAADMVSHMNDDTSSLPSRELTRILYGPDSVFARTPKLEQIARLTRQDVAQYLQTWQRPDSAVLGILGDFESHQMRREVEAALGSWRPAEGQPAQPLPLPSATPPQQPPGRQVFLIDLPGSTQASIAMGELGVSRTDPDAPALNVLTDILNGFGGSLFNQIRSKQGLAYSIGGGWNTSAIDHPGLFVAGGATASPAELLQVLGDSLQNVRSAGATEEELAAAKGETLNSFVFNFATTGQQLLQTIGCNLLGLPQDILYRYRDAVEAVTVADVKAAAQRHLHPLNHVMVIAADAAVLRPQLEAKGFVVQSLSPSTPD